MQEQVYEQLTLFPEDSRASRFPWLESKKAKRTTVISGRKCSELSENLRRVGSSVRTYLESCELPPGTWCRTWSVKDMTSRCLILKLRLSERRTEESGSFLWQTPVAEDAANRKFRVNSRGEPKLSGQVKLWPTVRSHEVGDYQYDRGDHSKKRLTLTGAAKMWPTPKARDWRGASGNEKRDSLDLNVVVKREANALFPTPRAQSATGASHAPNRQGGADLQTVVSDSQANGQLNPTWVEWLMGFPIGYTEVE